ncbi:MAG: hypothetical protein JXA20_03720 [Spirochaetes bacterium]|nr:hypothetical protein [Spirochaetota bacterium]
MKGSGQIQANEAMAAWMRVLLLVLLSAAFFFGFMEALTGYDFERLHIFLFNLTAGGFIIIHHSEGGMHPSARSLLFLALSLVYSVLAFLEAYLPAILVSTALAAVVESVRIRRFAFFPAGFFRTGTDTSEKFNQASLLCLSLALVISSLVILNNVYFHWITVRKLTLDVFFLGFSFPVSLITLSVMFGSVRRMDSRWFRLAGQAIFWTINLGVIVFFVFILMELFVAEVAVSSLLTLAVIATFFIFFKYGAPRQEKHFLVSGMGFLLFTAITGVTYIAVHAAAPDSAAQGVILSLHAYLSLYGWNLSGMLVIIRSGEFPLGFNPRRMIAMHWATVAFLVPLGMRFAPLAAAASVAFAIFLSIFLSGRSECRARGR